MNKTELQTILTAWIAERRLIIEVTLTAIVLMCYLLLYYGVVEAAVLMIPAMTLAAFYFISAFFPFGSDKIFVIICSKAMGIASAACMIGILFTSLGLEGKLQMFIAASTLLPATLFLLIDYLTSRRKESISLIARGVVLTIICFYFIKELLPQ